MTSCSGCTRRPERSHTRSACTPCSSRSQQASCSSPAHLSASPAASRGLLREPKVAFAAITSLLALGLIAQAIFIGADHLRQLRRALPVLLLPSARAAFALYARRGGGHAHRCSARRVLAVLAMRFPLSHYSARSSDSTDVVGRPADSRRCSASEPAPRSSASPPWCLPPSPPTSGFGRGRVHHAGAHGRTRRTGRHRRRPRRLERQHRVRATDTSLPADRTWIDHAEVGPVTLVEPPGTTSAPQSSSCSGIARSPASRFFPTPSRRLARESPDPRRLRRHAPHSVGPVARTGTGRPDEHLDDLRRREARAVDCQTARLHPSTCGTRPATACGSRRGRRAARSTTG